MYLRYSVLDGLPCTRVKNNLASDRTLTNSTGRAARSSAPAGCRRANGWQSLGKVVACPRKVVSEAQTCASSVSVTSPQTGCDGALQPSLSWDQSLVPLRTRPGTAVACSLGMA